MYLKVQILRKIYQKGNGTISTEMIAICQIDMVTTAHSETVYIIH